MRVFYWVMAVLILGTLVPATTFMLVYAATGEAACARRARVLWNYSRLFTMLGINILIWGHVAVALWDIWRH
jgi:hypothetical protein